MAIQLTYRQESNVLMVEISGKWTAHDMHDAIGAARAEADQRELASLLVDARGVSLPGSEMTRFFAGVRWAELFHARFRAAFVTEPLLFNGFALLVARNRGANVAAFFDEAPARKWLQES